MNLTEKRYHLQYHFDKVGYPVKFKFNTNHVSIVMKVRYMWRKSDTSPWYYRRKLPDDIKAILKQRGEPTPVSRVKSLRTHSDVLAVKMAGRETRKDDEYFYQLREGIATSKALKLAERQLNDQGLKLAPASAQTALIDLDLYYDKLQEMVPNNGQPKDYLDDVSLTTLQVLRGEYKLRLSDAESHYCASRGLSKKAMDTAVRSFKRVYTTLGDLPLTDYSRKDVSALITSLLGAGKKTATVSRELGVVRTAISELLLEHELTLSVSNAFAELKIPKLRQDAKQRPVYTTAQQALVRTFVTSKDGVTTNAVGILLDTGARLSEVIGLLCEDVVLDALVPHIVIVANEKRSLKTPHSTRKVPLVGHALLAAKQALVASDDVYLFPRYMRKGKVANGSASSTLNKALKSLGCPTTHSLRHTMRTRLRNANVPVPIVEEIQGWNDSSMAAYYGEQTALENMAAELKKTL